MENRALGKGLSALIPEKLEFSGGDNIKYLNLAAIKENTLQPREIYNDESLAELVASIKEKGILQPVLVRESGDKYEIIAGERRFRAARQLNFEKIPVIVKSVSDREALVLALVENIQRKELNAIEEANAFNKLVEDFDYTQDEVAQYVGKDRSTIANLIRLLKLPEEIQKSVKDGFLSMGHARALLSIGDSAYRKELFDRSIEKGLSVRELENLVKVQPTDILRPSQSTPKKEKDIYINSLEDDLRKFLGTKVRINKKQAQGQVVIDFYSSDDLDRIINLIKR